jgi:rhodanese-related sulfurtransferase
VTFFIDNIILIALAVASGGLLLWPLLSRRAGGTALSPLEATQLINHRNAIVVDLRDEKDFAAGSLAGARNIPQATLKERAGELSRFKARPLLVICAAGQQSTRALATFKEQGFEETFSMAGGIDAWKKAALPLVQAGRDNARPVTKEAAKGAAKRERDNRSKASRRLAANATPEAALVEAAVEPAGVVSGAGVPLAEAIAVTDESTPAKVV